MSIHEQLLEKAEKAIDAVFSDQSISREATKDSLESLMEHIQSMIDTLDEDEEENS